MKDRKMGVNDKMHTLRKLSQSRGNENTFSIRRYRHHSKYTRRNNSKHYIHIPMLAMRHSTCHSDTMKSPSNPLPLLWPRPWTL